MLQLNTAFAKKSLKIFIRPHHTTYSTQFYNMPASDFISMADRGNHYFRDLMIDGVTTVRVFDDNLGPLLFQKVYQGLRESPELKTHIPTHQFPVLTLGSFGAIGTASSLHAPILRYIFIMVLHALTRLLFCFLPKEFNVEPCPDRVCVRPKGIGPTAEGLHRDVSDDYTPHEFHCGGWVNLSPFDQVFECVKGSHFQHNQGEAGFQHVATSINDVVSRIVVPPYHAVVFNSNIKHAVSGAKAPGHYLKIFGGFLIKKGADSFRDTIINDPTYISIQIKERDNAIRIGFKPPMIFRSAREVCEAQAVFPLCSKQRMPAYSRNHYSRMTELETPIHIPGGLIGWSDQFIDAIPRVNETFSKNTPYVTRFAWPSLLELGRKYRDYTDGELQVYSGGPRRRWTGRTYDIHDNPLDFDINLDIIDLTYDQPTKKSKFF